MRDCIYIIRVNGRDESAPYAYGMYAADYSRAPTVICGCIYTIRCGRAR
ncbi:hypothetical protein [Prevotella pallens]|nr:hypothetical protein [Prevotella pallens]